MKLATSELVYINEAAKALKQKNFVLIDNVIIGLDNIQNMVIYAFLDTNFINNYHGGIIFNQRALSSFIKTISVESEFDFDSTNNIIRTISGGELLLDIDFQMAEFACEKFKYSRALENFMHCMAPESDVTNIMGDLYGMNNTDGYVGIFYKEYYMTLFPSILPLNKSDKIYLTIFKESILSNTFVSRFRIKKKKFDVFVYLNFITI